MPVYDPSIQGTYLICSSADRFVTATCYCCTKIFHRGPDTPPSLAHESPVHPFSVVLKLILRGPKTFAAKSIIRDRRRQVIYEPNNALIAQQLAAKQAAPPAMKMAVSRRSRVPAVLILAGTLILGAAGTAAADGGGNPPPPASSQQSSTPNPRPSIDDSCWPKTAGQSGTIRTFYDPATKTWKKVRC
jgi:hypothetical protein